MTYRKIFVYAAALLAFTPAVHAQQAPMIKVETLEVVPGENSAIQYVTGYAVNFGSKPYENAFISFNLLDAQGTLVGNATTHVQNLAPGQRWLYRAAAVHPFARVQVAKISGY